MSLFASIKSNVGVQAREHWNLQPLTDEEAKTIAINLRLCTGKQCCSLHMKTVIHQVTKSRLPSAISRNLMLLVTAERARCRPQRLEGVESMRTTAERGRAKGLCGRIGLQYQPSIADQYLFYSIYPHFPRKVRLFTSINFRLAVATNFRHC